jgi:hypothetical protein
MEKKSNTLNVVILETKFISLTGLKDFYLEVFNQLKYELDFVVITPDPSNFDGNKNVFKNNIVDIFITDLSLGRTDTDNYDGLDIIVNVKQKYPDLYIIANSSTNIKHLDTSSKIPSFDLFVHKRKMNDAKYKQYIKCQIEKNLKKNVFLTVDYEMSDTINIYNEPQKIELENLLRTITFTTHSSDQRTAVSRVVLKKIGGGMSKSKVFRLFGFTLDNIQCINVLIKLSSSDSGYTEYNNYLQYVKWYLPYTWRPEILSYATWNRMSCICYSFAFNDEVEFHKLTHYIIKKDLDKFNFVVDKIFDPKYRTWYHPKNVRKGRSITEYYHNKWIEGRANPDSRINQIISTIRDHRIKIINDNLIKIDDLNYTAPGILLIGQPRGEFLTCICHGDLNSENILISADNQITFIDFQDTGIGHIFDDFISLEISLRLHLITNLDFFTLLKNEKSSIQNSFFKDETNIENPEFIIEESILKIRKLAFQNFFPEKNFCTDDIANYLFALSISSYGMLRKDHFENWQKIQLLAILFASTYELSILESKK